MIFKSKRKLGKKIAIYATIGFAVTVFPAFYLLGKDNERAREAKALGFENYSEQQIAEKAGFTNALDWKKFQDQQAAMKEAEEAKKLAEQELQQAKDAGFESVESWKADLKEKEQLRLAEEEARKQAEAEQARVEQEAKAEQQKSDDIGFLKREIESIKEIAISDYTSDFQTIVRGIGVTKDWAATYDRMETSGKADPEIEALRQNFKSAAIAKQKQLFPAMRDAYGPVLRQMLWEHNGTAKTVGDGYRTIQTTAAIFANNANIKEVHLGALDSYRSLRFKRAEYRWIPSASEYSYYELDTPNDDQLVIWGSNGNYRVLE